MKETSRYDMSHSNEGKQEKGKRSECCRVNYLSPGLCLALSTECTNELSQWENSMIHMLTDQLSTQPSPPRPNCCADGPHPYQLVSPAPNPFLPFFFCGPVLSVPALLMVKQKVGKKDGIHLICVGHSPGSNN